MITLALFNLTVDTTMAWLSRGGYVALFGLLVLCGLGLPLPEDVPLITAGILVARGGMSLYLAAPLAWLGILGGDTILYFLGHRLGHNIVKTRFIGRHFTEARLQWTEKLFERYGVWVVAVGRMIAGVRGAMVVTAGTIRYSYVKFIIADGLAAIVSGGFFLSVGYFIGRHLEDIGRKVRDFEWGFSALVIIAALILILYVRWRRKRHKTLADVALEKTVEVVEQHPPQP